MKLSRASKNYNKVFCTLWLFSMGPWSSVVSQETSSTLPEKKKFTCHLTRKRWFDSNLEDNGYHVPAKMDESVSAEVQRMKRQPLHKKYGTLF